MLSLSLMENGADRDKIIFQCLAFKDKAGCGHVLMLMLVLVCHYPCMNT